ncbi:hypothetical protein N9741_01970 [Octadecabacter sp.]|nr:hypothetical protein [Octadecabacter sp.]
MPHIDRFKELKKIDQLPLSLGSNTSPISLYIGFLTFLFWTTTDDPVWKSVILGWAVGFMGLLFYLNKKRSPLAQERKNIELLFEQNDLWIAEDVSGELSAYPLSHRPF